MNKKIVETIVNKCLGHKKSEQLLIVCDDKLHGLAFRFYKFAKSLGIEAVLLEMQPRRMHGEEPPSFIGEALKKADSAVLLTSMSLSHTKARKEASSRFGTRIASLPGVTEEILNRSILINYTLLKKKADRLSSLLTKAKIVEIHTKRGTNIVMSIKERKGFSDNGLYLKKRAFGNLPAGEACIAPLEGTTYGRLVVDGSAPLVGKLKQAVSINIKDGHAQKIPIKKISSSIRHLGKRALNVAELGIGLNNKARVTGNVLEDEKVIGTAHIAFGSNISFGGKVSCPCHLDFVFFNPTILIDGIRLKV